MTEFDDGDDEIQRVMAQAEHDMNVSFQEATRLSAAMRRLLENDDFKEYQKRLNDRIEDRTASLFFHPTGLDSVIGDLYLKGEVAGLRIAKEFAKVLLGFAKEEIAQYERRSSLNE